MTVSSRLRVCKVGVLQYFLCNYTLAHLYKKKAVLTLFSFAFMCFECVMVGTKDAAFFVQKRIKIWEVRVTIVMVS